MAYIDTVKGWFNYKDAPSETQFSQTFNWLRWKDEKIPMNDVNGLNEIFVKKADKQAFEAHLRDEDIHVTQREKKKWNKGTVPFNLSEKPVFLKYKYFGSNVYGVLLQTPTKENDTYVFTHNLNINKYLRLEVWEDGLPFTNPKMKAREDLSQLVYSELSGAIGESPIGSTPIGGGLNGQLLLENNTMVIKGNYVFPNNKLVYIEFTKE